MQKRLLLHAHFDQACILLCVSCTHSRLAVAGVELARGSELAAPALPIVCCTCDATPLPLSATVLKWCVNGLCFALLWPQTNLLIA
jgi:hypothetical protein